MNALQQALKEALTSSGTSKEANKAYLEFIKANFIIPVEKTSDNGEPVVLFLHEKNQLFLPVFTDMDSLKTWASDIAEEINLLKLSGVDLLKGVGDNVTICLNIGTEFYKEFNPIELGRMRSMILKLFKNN